MDEMLKMKFDTMPFEGQFLESFGEPEVTGVWIVWGNSGNGKTRFCLQLAKYLGVHAKVAYNTLEEGARFSMQRAIQETGMREVARRFVVLDREPIDELMVRMGKRRSPDVYFIDSIQYTGMRKADYKLLKEHALEKGKLLIFNSHAEGKHPEGRLAKFVRYDADVKIRVEGYRAFPVSRYGGGEPYTIWHEGADEYWAL